jgi:hypothetical protein
MPIDGGARSSRAAGVGNVGRQARTNDAHRSEARGRSNANRYIEIDRAHAPEGNFDLGDICVPLSRRTKKRLMNECAFAHGPASGVTARIGTGGGATPVATPKLVAMSHSNASASSSYRRRPDLKKAGARSLKLWCGGNLVRASNERQKWPPAVNLGPGKSHDDLALGKVGV